MTWEDGRTIPYKGDAAQVEKKSNSSSAPATAKKRVGVSELQWTSSQIGPYKVNSNPGYIHVNVCVIRENWDIG